jgi:hypothetical protein
MSARETVRAISPIAIPYIVLGTFIVVAALYDIAINTFSFLN